MYQSLNIIGSFTAGTTTAQQQVHADKSRGEAYRSLLKDQVRQGNPVDPDTPVGNVDTDRITIGDSPEEQRAPYLVKSKKRPPASSTPLEETSLPMIDSSEEDGPGHLLDTVI